MRAWGPQGGNIGIMEKKMETTIVYWGYIWVITAQDLREQDLGFW